MTLNQLYNKTIQLKEPTLEIDDFDLSYLVYNGKLSIIAEYVNKLTIEETVKLVNQIKEDRSSLQISAFLGFQNIFLYLLTFDADIYYLDENKQNICHFISYKGEVKNLLILFNFLRFRLKMETLEAIENIKKTYNFSKLDVNRGKLSRAVNYTESNLKRFETFQRKLREEAYNLIAKSLKIFQILFSQRDENGRNPIHYAAMSKYPLCYLIVENFLEFDLFKLQGWEEFLCIFEDLQNLEVKEERVMDPRRCNRLEKELSNLLGEAILTELSAKFKNGKNEIIKNIVNMQDNISDTVLHVAAFHGDYRIVNKLLTYGADKTIRNQDRKLPVDLAKDNYVRKVLTNLNKAAKNSDSKNITELVHFGHDINSKLSIFSQAPIHKVIESTKDDKYKVLKKMLDMGADPNIQDSNGWSALHYSAELGDFEAVKILLNSKAKIDCYSNNKKTPLHFAASHNFADIVKYILEKASENSFGFTFNPIAKKNDFNKTLNNKDLNKLEENNKNLNPPNSKNTISTNINSKSAQNFYSTRSNNININNNSLINNSIITNNTNKNQNLVINKNDLIYNKKDSNGCTPLHLAAKHGATESLAILLVFGSDLYAEDFRKWNIMHYAAFQGYPKTVRFISKYDCDFSILKSSRNSQNKLAIEIVREHTIKHYFNNIWEAAKEGSLDLLRNLLNEGENINEKSTFLVNTPLHLAVFNNHYLMVRLLLENQANIGVKNKEGITVEEYSELINFHVSRVHAKFIAEGKCDIMKVEIDWKDVVRNVFDTNEKTLNALISRKNSKVKLWKMVDFSNKINELLKDGSKTDTNLTESKITQDQNN